MSDDTLMTSNRHWQHLHEQTAKFGHLDSPMHNKSCHDASLHEASPCIRQQHCWSRESSHSYSSVASSYPRSS